MVADEPGDEVEGDDTAEGVEDSDGNLIDSGQAALHLEGMRAGLGAFAEAVAAIRERYGSLDTSGIARALLLLQESQPSILAGVQSALAARQSLENSFSSVPWDTVQRLTPLLAARLSSPGGFDPDDVESESDSGAGPGPSYSDELDNPGSYFKMHQGEIKSFDQLNKAIKTLIDTNPDLTLVWRGARDSSWALHSSLFRRLTELNGVQHPTDKPNGRQPFPDEDQMVKAEKKILQLAREEWRFDGTPGMELLARLQHFGAPTRLLDVSRNPYIAAWFAVESHARDNDAAARLFAIATTPVVPEGESPSPVFFEADAVNLRDPFWHFFKTNELREEADWGTGSRRRVWIPPGYEQRMVAQNAGFILDGVPMVSRMRAPYFKRRPNASEYWRKDDLLAASSIYAKTYRPDRTARPNKQNFAPTFSFLITAEAKAEIRDVLERRFSYSTATIYADLAALASYIGSNVGEIIAD